MLRYFIAAIAIFCTVLGISKARSEEPTSVTLVDLIANSEKYLDKEVSVMGYFAVHSNLMLFESKAHSESRAYQYTIVVGDYDQMELHRSECIDKMVEMTGVFVQWEAGDISIIGVTRITLVSTGELCWEYEIE